MRALALALAACLAATGLAHAMPPLAPRAQLSEADRNDLDRISAYLNAMHTLKGSFIQLDPDGTADEGVFDIEKPGRMRFEYHAPNPILIVSDGSTVAVQNRRLNTIDHYPLWATPLDLILSDDLDLKDNRAIVSVSREPGEIIVNARSQQNHSEGDISLVFSDPDIELRQWTIVDAQGLTTTVSLNDLQSGAALDPSLFVLPKKDDLRKQVE